MRQPSPRRPGTKSTLADLPFFRAQGWDIDLAGHVRRGGRVLGVCGGYQMLGRVVADALGVERGPGEAAGLGLLDLETVLAKDKVLQAVSGEDIVSGARFSGYEMHVGRTSGPASARPFLRVEEQGPHGARSPDGRIMGGYVHGLFQAGSFRRAFLAAFGAASVGCDYGATVDAALHDIAEILGASLDTGALLRIAGTTARVCREGHD